MLVTFQIGRGLTCAITPWIVLQLVQWLLRICQNNNTKGIICADILLSLRPTRKTSTRSAVNLKKQLTLMSSLPEPAVWSHDTNQRIPWFYSCQLINIITWMFIINGGTCGNGATLIFQGMRLGVRTDSHVTKFFRSMGFQIFGYSLPSDRQFLWNLDFWVNLTVDEWSLISE